MVLVSQGIAQRFLYECAGTPPTPHIRVLRETAIQVRLFEGTRLASATIDHSDSDHGEQHWALPMRLRVSVGWGVAAPSITKYS